MSTSVITQLKQKIVDKYPEADIQFTSFPERGTKNVILNVRVKSNNILIRSLPNPTSVILTVKPIVLTKGQVLEHRQVIKKPWFHSAFITILKENPDFTEEDMVGEIVYYDDDGYACSSFNTNVVEDIVYTETVIKDVTDPNHSYCHFSVYPDGREYLKSIPLAIDHLLQQ